MIMQEYIMMTMKCVMMIHFVELVKMKQPKTKVVKIKVAKIM